MPGPRRQYQSTRRWEDQTRINNRIKVPEVRLIDEEGTQLGVVTTKEALQLAYDKGLDLVEVAAQANPPVCRIIDYGKFKYEQKQRQKAAKKNSSKSTMKELKFRPKIGKHDIDVRIKHAKKFLFKGFKVRLIVRFRGREHSHPDIASDLLNKVYKALENICDIESPARKEGAIMSMNLGPSQVKITEYMKKIAKGDIVEEPVDSDDEMEDFDLNDMGDEENDEMEDEVAAGIEDIEESDK
ncbi:translation initiation factor IF-3 [bacterium]|nr:translation initiation factor IF-3 [bacterium]MBU1025489.1 translation initiation factor IF-3 [bacterium]